jgi:lipopolysaccharide transport system ATP-binding protein
MSEIAQGALAIRFEHVAKRFQINRSNERSLMELLQRPFGAGQRKQYFWPLKDVSFDVPWGSSIGIIGENGAGKSTILKLISRILEPTGGNVEINGGVSALLELGAGFHPELTGRENIFLAASVANISRTQIKRDIHRIIDFADIGSYIDMPVKHYSSGMYMRLGFAVAVHLRPQILLIDEVLAIGDESFQHKCLARIAELMYHGTTVVLISHSMEQVAELCSTALWLHDGYICSSGDSKHVIADYLSASAGAEQAALAARLAAGPREPGSAEDLRWGDGAIQVRDVRLLGGDGRPAGTFTPESPLRIEFDYEVVRPVATYPAFGFGIYRLDGVWCYGTNTALDRVRLSDDPLPRRGTVTIDIHQLGLLHGDYSINLDIHAPSGDVTHDHVHGAARFTVHNQRGDQGVFRPKLNWSLYAQESERGRQ